MTNKRTERQTVFLLHLLIMKVENCKPLHFSLFFPTTQMKYLVSSHFVVLLLCHDPHPRDHNLID